MFDINELFFQVNRMKMRHDKILSNNFLQKSVIEHVSNQEKSMLAYNQDAIALICCENGVERLYFYVSCLEKAAALRDLLCQAEGSDVVADCVGKEACINAISQALCKNGFSPYARLTRWRSGKIYLTADPVPDEMCFQAAVPEQTNEILALLYKIFDPYVSKLPSGGQLGALIEQELVYCAVQNGGVIGTVCLQKVGKTGIYIYQIAVSEEHRAIGLGSSLLRFALRRFNTLSTFTSWIEGSNEASRRMHRALGMREDGLVDAVLIYRAQN